jgi:hypothetical protein
VITLSLKAIFLLLAAVCTSIFLGPRGLATASEYPDALLLYPGAKEVWRGRRAGTDQLTYHVKERLPASGVIDWISAKLWDQNWRPLPYDALEPNDAVGASQLRGWHPLIDATGSTRYCVQQWLGDWKDRSGNIVRYAFHYKLSRDCAPNSDDLEVSAVYVPAPLVKQMREAFKRFKQEHKAQ